MGKTHLTEITVLESLQRNGSISAAAKELSVNRATLSKFINSADYQNFQKDYQQGLLQAYTAHLMALNERAINELSALINEPTSPKTRLNAVKLALQESRNYLMMTSLEGQVKELQNKLDNLAQE